MRFCTRGWREALVNTEGVLAALATRMQQAWHAGDRPTVEFCSGAIAQIKALAAIAQAAAQVYHDQRQDGAWEALFEALAGTEYLDQGERPRGAAACEHGGDPGCQQCHDELSELGDAARAEQRRA